MVSDPHSATLTIASLPVASTSLESYCNSCSKELLLFLFAGLRSSVAALFGCRRRAATTAPHIDPRPSLPRSWWNLHNHLKKVNISVHLRDPTFPFAVSRYQRYHISGVQCRTVAQKIERCFGSSVGFSYDMRRSSNAVLQTQTSEPLIVVEDDEYEKERQPGISRQISEDESTTMNPYLLSPFFRDIRKRSLPTPQCSGITASQVRRLSERGETSGPGPRQAEFLATLSTAQQPSGGRRHSVVTISRVPPALFGRNRRESVAAFPSSGFPSRILPNRRESIACPPSTEPRGSVHNLQLDIMDDIVQARKVRMKMWNTSNERVCEVQPLDESGTVQRYTNSSRRFSDFVGTTLAPIPSVSKRRASDFPQSSVAGTSGTSKIPSSGIVCSNTDLISILSSLSTSATEINQCEKDHTTDKDGNKETIQQKRGRLKSNRSNSFDISILHGTEIFDDENKSVAAPSNWFIKRHQPMTKTDSSKCKAQTRTVKETRDGKNIVETEPGRVVWDERSGSIVDPHALGSAIEVFLRQTTPDTSSVQSSDTSPTKNNNKVSTPKGAVGRPKSWFSKGDDDSTETCDSSICSTLKDLFVK
ncbi:hypothetical protein NQ317_003584 [Molorchus minor]|uniref:Uncharacterized protein n=1 Tax=Molorchus minor TaxID=1323400 RepID=A0ABQ9JE71_9CUCU|nr:hypothetical protein NQ317_003584 [Molorchus minor]